MFKESFANVQEENNNISITGTSQITVDDEVAVKSEAQLKERVVSELVEESISNVNSEDSDKDSEDEYDELMRVESEDDEEDDEEMVVESNDTKRILIYFGIGILVSFIIGLLIKLLFFNKKSR